RWMAGRSDYPLYPSARLFRQSRSGVWADVIASVAAEVAEAARKKAATTLTPPRLPAAAPPA
ncbi:MAG: hypothetical protein ACRD9L_02555, partial [Bryobacteraceae bacterium]